MLDPIAEMLSRIKNAQRAGKPEVLVGVSKLKLAIAQILEREGFIRSYGKEGDGHQDKIRIDLKYYDISNTRRIPAISQIVRKSKEGQRIYIRSKDIKSVKNRAGISVISTSKGLMTGEEAKKHGLGGECICEVW